MQSRFAIIDGFISYHIIQSLSLRYKFDSLLFLEPSRVPKQSLFPNHKVLTIPKLLSSSYYSSADYIMSPSTPTISTSISFDLLLNFHRSHLHYHESIYNSIRKVLGASSHSDTSSTVFFVSTFSPLQLFSKSNSGLTSTTTIDYIRRSFHSAQATSPSFIELHRITIYPLWIKSLFSFSKYVLRHFLAILFSFLTFLRLLFDILIVPSDLFLYLGTGHLLEKSNTLCRDKSYILCSYHEFRFNKSFLFSQIALPILKIDLYFNQLIFKDTRFFHPSFKFQRFLLTLLSLVYKQKHFFRTSIQFFLTDTASYFNLYARVLLDGWSIPFTLLPHGNCRYDIHYNPIILSKPAMMPDPNLAPALSLLDHIPDKHILYLIHYSIYKAHNLKYDPGLHIYILKLLLNNLDGRTLYISRKPGSEPTDHLDDLLDFDPALCNQVRFVPFYALFSFPAPTTHVLSISHIGSAHAKAIALGYNFTYYGNYPDQFNWTFSSIPCSCFVRPIIHFKT